MFLCLRENTAASLVFSPGHRTLGFSRCLWLWWTSVCVLTFSKAGRGLLLVEGRFPPLHFDLDRPRDTQKKQKDP